jgi:hypothetical protein
LRPSDDVNLVRASPSFHGQARADDVVLDGEEDELWYARVLQLLAIRDDQLGMVEVAIVQWYESREILDHPLSRCPRLKLLNLVDIIPASCILDRVHVVRDFTNRNEDEFLLNLFFLTPTSS